MTYEWVTYDRLMPSIQRVLNRQLSLKRLVILEVEQHVIELEAYRANLASAKVPVSSNLAPSLAMHEERAKTYKEVAQKFQLQTRAIDRSVEGFERWDMLVMCK